MKTIGSYKGMADFHVHDCRRKKEKKSINNKKKT